jgi:hypothetical protein
MGADENHGWYDFYEILKRERDMGLIAGNTPTPPKPEQVKPKWYKVSFFGVCEMPGLNEAEARKHFSQFCGKHIKVQAVDISETPTDTPQLVLDGD